LLFSLAGKHIPSFMFDLVCALFCMLSWPLSSHQEKNMSRDTSRVRHVRETLLSDNWYTLKKYTFELLRRDGRWQEQSREAYDRGNGAVILLYNRVKQTVVLIRQFRFPVWINGHDGFLIEAAAGLLDNASPEERIIAEAEEETGFRVTGIEPVFTAYMSPGSVTEKLYFFIAEYSADDRRGEGGGLAAEGEDIEVLEWPLARALQAIREGKLWMPKPLCYCNTWLTISSRLAPDETRRDNP
jgi:nudix-type nucleoside diphosphatase (YffH/AdpP family)